MEQTNKTEQPNFKQVVNNSITGESAVFEKDHAKQEQNENYICSKLIQWTIKAQAKIQKIDGVNFLSVSPERFLVNLLNAKYGITLDDLNRDYKHHIKAQIDTTQTHTFAIADLTPQPQDATQEQLNKFYKYALECRKLNIEWSEIRENLLKSGLRKDLIDFYCIKFGDGKEQPVLNPVVPQFKPSVPVPQF